MKVRNSSIANNALKNYKRNRKNTEVHIRRLATGKKINFAADDAAGLAISDKMTAQIRGLEMANKNAEDGISLLQTADGGLTEINNMLFRIRDLAVESANGIYENADRENIQKEVKQLIKEIDETSSRTEFNKMKLLNGDLCAETGTYGASGGG